MKTMPLEIKEKLENNLPNFINACNEVEEGMADAVLLMLDAFVNEPELLYEALWYAQEHYVEVRIIPRSLLQEKVQTN